MKNSGEVTLLLERWAEGDREALDALMPFVQQELKRLAASRLRRERPGHTLQPTALVNEAYLRLVKQRAGARSRAHFFGLAAAVMQRILVDHAKRKHADKRDAMLVSIHDDLDAADEREMDLLELDDALRRLAEHDDRAARIVSLRYFGGLTQDEISEVLGISRATIKRDWTVARAWLKRELKRSGDER